MNMTDEAPENADFDSIHHHLVQRGRVLESCIAELKAQRGLEASHSRRAGRRAFAEWRLTSPRHGLGGRRGVLRELSTPARLPVAPGARRPVCLV